MINFGKGKFAPLDTNDFIEITLFVKNGDIEKAEYNCSNGERIEDCAKTLCASVVGFPVIDIFQTNNNVVYYNLDTPLERKNLHCASIAVMAAKKAALDYCKKNNITPPETDGMCDCLNK